MGNCCYHPIFEVDSAFARKPNYNFFPSLCIDEDIISKR